MSVFQTTKIEEEKNKRIFDVQSKVIEHQILSQNSNISNFELCNVIKENIKEVYSSNSNEYPKRQCSRKEVNSFYSKIKFIRKKYNIKKSRKNHIDSLVKKAKSKFLKGIYEVLKYLLNSYKYKNRI